MSKRILPLFLLAACNPPAPGNTAASSSGGAVPPAASQAATVNNTPTQPNTTTAAAAGNPAHHPVRKPDVPSQKAEPAPAPSTRAGNAPKAAELAKALDTYFEGHPGRRIHIQVDKPMYQPGETVWVKTWDLRAKGLVGNPSNGITYQLISPRGATVLEKFVQQQGGTATNDLPLAEGMPGGEYVVRARAQDGTQVDRPIIINAYEAPRIKKKLEFVRKAYGAGDEVTATLELKRPTGEPLANQVLTVVATVDGQELPRGRITTSATGEALARVTLPKDLQVGDGLLTVLVEDGGITESISRSIPIILRRVQMTFFPEGGAMVAGLPTRLYFEARNPLGKPADVEGHLVDDVGNKVGAFSTYKNGLGRVAFTPGTGRSYQAVITRPVGVTERFPLPLAESEGCVLRTFDDVDGELPELRVQVSCTTARKVVVTAVLRDHVLDTAVVDVAAEGSATVYLRSTEAALMRAQGVARVTVLDESNTPLAERVVFRNRRAGMRVKVAPHKPAYSPRDQVVLQVATTDAAGQPVPAQLAMSVVDDTVISLADDKNGHMLTHVLLEPELPGKVEEPAFYLDLTEEKSALALELLMGTRGWRRFDWQPVFNPPLPVPEASGLAADGFGEGGGGIGALGGAKGGKVANRGGVRGKPMPAGAPAAAPPPAEMLAQAAAPPPAPVLAPAAARPQKAAAADKNVARKDDAADGPAANAVAAKPMEPAPDRGAEKKMKRAQAEEAKAEAAMEQEAPMRARRAMRDEMDADDRMMAKERFVPAFAPVRVFPAPRYSGADDSPRTDFRETIHFEPTILTGKDGTATVTFYMSDAVTSFRVFTEGLGAGELGRDETVLKSNLPFSMAIKLPTEVSAGDTVMMPLTLTNDTDKPLAVELDAAFGPLVQLKGPMQGGRPTLAPGARHSVFFPLEVGQGAGRNKVALFAHALGLKDEFSRELNVTPLGFPMERSQAGRVKGSVEAAFDLGDLVDGTAVASVRLYPSPLSGMMQGLEGMLREPSGCFEQTSSSNYPNIMIMQYLREYDVQDASLLQRTSQLMTTGYQRLVGYETPQKGYEWFGGAPGHEALTAYGLMEFRDMKGVFPDVDDAMVTRTASWLKSRRDGKGGFQRDPKALDSFGSASPEVTNGYIAYALSESGDADLQPELDAQRRVALEAQDAYLLALAANTLLNNKATASAGQAAVVRLVKLQDADGAWRRADHSITRSGGQNLHVETTALATLALLKSGGHEGPTQKAVEWLNNARGGFGQWSATQATILALKALAQFARTHRVAPMPGKLTVTVNGKPAGTHTYPAGYKDPIVLTDLGVHFKAGRNVVKVTHDGAELPYSVSVEYRSRKPDSSPECVVGLETKLAAEQVKMGETTRLTTTVQNRTDKGQPMTLARVGIPAGLTAQVWQLKELREKGVISFFETGPREVILYFRDLKPSASVVVPLDLQATVPGNYTAPASSAYLYYNNEHRTWLDPLHATITP